MTTAEDLRVDSDSVLMVRGSNPNVPCLETRVAYQFESELDILGHRHSKRRNQVVLDWLAAALEKAPEPRAGLDVGCAYGNHVLMLNAKLHKQSVTLIGVDLYDEGLAFARAFAARVPGYDNCHFQAANLAEGLPFPDSTFDAVSLSDVLEHMDSPENAIRELMRVAKPGGTIVISTPLRTGLYKSLARILNKVMRGRLYEQYYEGKNTTLDEEGKPIMNTPAGHGHVSEMSYKELMALAARLNLKVEEVHLMSVFSGSRWFDRHMFLLAILLMLEGLHDRLRRPSWAHSVCLRLKTPEKAA